MRGPAEVGADPPGRVVDLRGGGQRRLFGRVDRDREGRRPDGPAVVLDGAAGGVRPGQRLGQPGEVPRAAGQLETDQVGAEQAVDDLAAPRQPHEQLDRRERDVQEEPDPHVRPEPPQQLRHQLQLVVVHPDGRAGGGDVGGRLGELRVDPLVGLPPDPVELRIDDRVVVQRPQGVVGEALVEALDVVGGQGDREQAQPVGGGRLQGDVGRAGPADPRAVPAGQDRGQRGDQPAGRLPGLGAPVGQRLQVERQPVGDHHHGGLAHRLADLVLGGLRRQPGVAPAMARSEPEPFADPDPSVGAGLVGSRGGVSFGRWQGSRRRHSGRAYRRSAGGSSRPDCGV